MASREAGAVSTARGIFLGMALALTLSPNAFSQEFVDLFKLYYSYSPNNDFDQSTEASTVEEWGGEVLLPFPLKNDHVLITGLAFEKTQVKLLPGAETSSLYTINPRLGINLRHSTHWSGQYILLPQIASDLSGPFTGDDVQLGGIAIISYEHRENLSYRFGAYYNASLFGPGTFLIAGFYYKSPNKLWLFDFNMPIWGDINYKLSEKWSTGFRYDGMLRSYYLNTSLVSNQAEYVAKLSPEVFGYLQLAVAKNYIIQLKIGHSIGRSYRFFEEGDRIDLGFTGLNIGDKRQQLNTDFEDGFVFQLRFHYRFYIEKTEKAPVPEKFP